MWTYIKKDLLAKRLNKIINLIMFKGFSPIFFSIYLEILGIFPIFLKDILTSWRVDYACFFSLFIKSRPNWRVKRQFWAWKTLWKVNNGKKQAWRNVGLNLRVKMALRNNYGHAYGHKEKNWALQHPQRLKPSFWA